MMEDDRQFFATAPLGLEGLLADELAALGAEHVRETRAGVHFEGDLACAYRGCLWSRLANRILLPLAQFPAASPDGLYDGVRTVNWSEHLRLSGTLAVDFVSSRSRITHELFGAQKVKDAIVDQFLDRQGRRPDVSLSQPDIRVNLHLDRDIATLSLDLSGESLHRRGYRLSGGSAPLKENLAAAVLIRGGWPMLAEAGSALLDPMCGSGTLPIEAALIAADIAPGLLRRYFGFLGWEQHQPEVWAELVAEAVARRSKGLERMPRIVGHDIGRDAVAAAWENVERAQLQGRVHIERQALGHARPHGERAGLVVVNPPYGERLGEVAELTGLYRQAGEVFRDHFQGWRLTMLTGNPELAFQLGIRAQRHYALYNGRIPCRLFNFEIVPERFFTPRPVQTPGHSAPVHQPEPAAELSESGQMFANRLRKNLRHLGRWARQNGIHCYRLYDADLPEYAVAVDLYQNERVWAHVQEYQAPSSIDPAKAELRLAEACTAVMQVLDIPREQFSLKVRKRQKGLAQYDRQADSRRYFEVGEGGLRFLVNLDDYLDTGLFLDHRPTRSLLRELARGRTMLNLFCYTATASVYAAAGGALSTTSVDLSNTYLDWAGRNFQMNGMDERRHELIRADVLEWLGEARSKHRRYDLIFLDPPTFSHSKAMSATLDVQRDHVALLQAAAALLTPAGILIFSTNATRFKLDADAIGNLSAEDISHATLPKDFERNPRIHRCWKITRRVQA